jgi:hypothetical protein
MSNHCPELFGLHPCLLPRGHEGPHSSAGPAANVKLDQGPDGTRRVYEQAEVDALVAAAEEAGFNAGVLDMVSVAESFADTCHWIMPKFKHPGELARHDAELREQVLEEAYQAARGGDDRFEKHGTRQLYWKGRSDAAIAIRALKESHAAAAKKG